MHQAASVTRHARGARLPYCRRVASDIFDGAASSLLAGLFDGVPVHLVEVARTRVSVYYETGDAAVPVLSMCTPSAVRLPNSFVTDVLPGPNEARLNTERGALQHRTGRASTGGGVGTIGDGVLTGPSGTWRVARWWLPPRPCGLCPPPIDVVREATALVGRIRTADAPLRVDSPSRWCGVPTLSPSYDGLVPAELIGTGPGLTPAGDDLVAGALVTAYATADPRLAGWRRRVSELLTTGRTTAVSRTMLHSALDGYATTELADYVRVVCDGGPRGTVNDLEQATKNLLAVGHSSGAALVTGVLHTFSTTRMQGAA